MDKQNNTNIDEQLIKQAIWFKNFYLTHVGKNKFPHIASPLLFSYFEEKLQKTITKLKEAYDKKLDKISLLWQDRKHFRNKPYGERRLW